MIRTLLQDREESAISGRLPHLSHSRVNRYLLCPEQYRLYYVENLRPKVAPASLVFGQVVHQALAELFSRKKDPAQWFQTSWKVIKDVELRYGARDSWEKLSACGENLLKRFITEELPKLSNIRGVEKAFELTITDFDLPLVGIIDLVADLNRKATVVDFKTSGSEYDAHEVALSDQLTAYKLAEPQVDQLALCVLVKTKEPKIEWHLTRREGGDLTEYLAKVGHVAREIAASRFYKRPGLWCAWCDFLPVCLKDTRKVKETLVTIE